MKQFWLSVLSTPPRAHQAARDISREQFSVGRLAPAATSGRPGSPAAAQGSLHTRPGAGGLQTTFKDFTCPLLGSRAGDHLGPTSPRTRDPER